MTSTAASTWREAAGNEQGRRCIAAPMNAVALRMSDERSTLEEVGVDFLHAACADTVGELDLRVVAGADGGPTPLAVCCLHAEASAAKGWKLKERKLKGYAPSAKRLERRGCLGNGHSALYSWHAEQRPPVFSSEQRLAAPDRIAPHRAMRSRDQRNCDPSARSRNVKSIRRFSEIR